MGDWMSSKSTANTVQNHQASQQISNGSIGLALSSNNFSNSPITVINADRDIALAAIEASQGSSNAATIAAIASNRTGTEALAVASKGLDIAGLSVTLSHKTIEDVFGYMSDQTRQTNALLTSTIGTAEQIALNAAPVSPGSYAESIAGDKSDITKVVIYSSVAIASLYLLMKFGKS